MKFLRNHWYKIGGCLGIITLVLVYVFRSEISNYQLLMWLSLISLFFHQVEEYWFPGTFPGMINRVMFKSNHPERYPLNSNTSLIINVGIAWTIYFMAALTGKKYIWLGMASMVVSLGNILAHTFLFNIKGKTWYNAGMATALLLFVPCVWTFFKIINIETLATPTDYFVGIPLGICINVAGVLKMIGWLANKDSKFIFEKRQLLREERVVQKGISR